MPTMIAFKTPSALQQWPNLIPSLKAVIFDLLHIWPDHYLEITRIADPSPPESGVHLQFPHQAIDARTNDLTPDKGETLARFVNTRYHYNHPTKPHLNVALQHGQDSERHLHLQWRKESAKVA